MTAEDETERARVVALAAMAALVGKLGQQPRAYRWRELSIRETRGMLCMYGERLGYVGDYEPAASVIAVHWPGGGSSWAPTGDVWLLTRGTRG